MIRLARPCPAHPRASGDPGQNCTAYRAVLDSRFRGNERRKSASAFDLIGSRSRFYSFLFRRGTFFPFCRASDRPIAIACFRLVTFLPLRPLLSVPFLRFFIARSTSFEALLEYLRAILFLLDLYACGRDKRLRPKTANCRVWSMVPDLSPRGSERSGP